MIKNNLYYDKDKLNWKKFTTDFEISLFNPLTSPRELVSVFTYPYLNAGAPLQGEAKGLMNGMKFLIIII